MRSLSKVSILLIAVYPSVERPQGFPWVSLSFMSVLQLLNSLYTAREIQMHHGETGPLLAITKSDRAPRDSRHTIYGPPSRKWLI